MLKVPYEQIIEAVVLKSKLSESEVEGKIKAKMDQLAGLISKEGAAHIVANELGVTLFNENEPVKIRKIVPGMRNLQTVGKITKVYPVKEFQKKDGSTGKLASFVLADSSGTIRVVLWNDMTDKINELEEGIVLQLKDPFVKENQEQVELHCNTNTDMVKNPEGVSIEINQTAARRKISDLKSNDSNVELLGTVVQAFEPRFYEVCPDCGKRARPKEDAFACENHGKVIPNHAYVMNAVLDDGSSTIRSVFFRNQVDTLLEMQNPEVLTFKDAPQAFQEVKDKLLGKIVKVTGRIKKNDMFDRLEFVSTTVEPNPSPDQEMQRLDQEASTSE